MLRNARATNFRRVFQFNRWLHYRFSATGKLILIILALSGVIGLDTTRTLSYQIFSASLALIIIAIFYSMFTKVNIDCKRQLPPLATAGKTFQYHIALSNNSKHRQCNLQLTDKLQDQFPTTQDLSHYFDLQSDKENWFDRSVGYPRWSRLLKLRTGASNPTRSVSDIRAGQTIDLPVTITPMRRGYIYFTDICLGKPDPVGLFRKIHQNKISDRLLVLPKRYSIPHLNLPGKRHYHQGGVELASAIGETSEFHGLRDYQPGDPLRHIHWRSWARTGAPVVKKYEDEFFVRHALILDTYLENNRPRVFEEAVSVAASIALSLDDQESLLDLMFVEQRAYQFTTGRHLDDIQSMMEILACVQPEQDKSIHTLRNFVLQHAAHLSSAICVLMDWDSPRQQMVTELEDHNIDILVIVISDKPQPPVETENQAARHRASRLLWLDTEKIEQGLMQLAKLSRDTK